MTTVHIVLIVLLMVVAGCGGPSSLPRQESVARPEKSRVDRLEVSPEKSKVDWSELPDFDKLRSSYGERDDFSAVCEQDRPLSEAFEALDARQWQKIIKLADGWLPQCKVDIDFHFLRAIALGELGREEESRQQLRWRDGLVDSILRSGDGKTPQTAWVVISVAEEYSILRMFGMRRRSQALTRERLDMIEAERDGEIYTLYFNPQAHFRRLDKMFATQR